MLPLLKNVIGYEIGSRAKIGMRIFHQPNGAFGVAGATWAPEPNWTALHSYAAIAERNLPSTPKSACRFVDR